MEESSAWRHPIDLIEILEEAFGQLADALATGEESHGSWDQREQLIEVLLQGEPSAIVNTLLVALRNGCSSSTLAETVTYAAALRIARFHTSNEFADWDTALHTFTFANAIQQGLQRAPSVELLRGVFDAAMSVYLDRFLKTVARCNPCRNGAAARPSATGQPRGPTCGGLSNRR